MEYQPTKTDLRTNWLTHINFTEEDVLIDSEGREFVIVDGYKVLVPEFFD